jgi:hypothetical protein
VPEVSGCGGTNSAPKASPPAGGSNSLGSPDSPDVICEELSNLHMEVKFVEALNLDKACEQAERDSRGKRYIVAHKKKNKAWKVTMPSDTFFALLRDGMQAIIK